MIVASNEMELINTYLPWLLGFVTILGSIYAGFKVLTKYLICRGKAQANNENRIKLIEDRILEMLDEFDTFKKWANGEHEEMNTNVEKRFAELSQVTSELKDAVAETNGYLKRLAEEKS